MYVDNLVTTLNSTFMHVANTLNLSRCVCNNLNCPRCLTYVNPWLIESNNTKEARN